MSEYVQINAQKLVTNLMDGNRHGVVVKGSAESSENRLAEALNLYITVDTARVLVAMRSSGKCRELPRRISRNASVVEGE